LLGSTFKSSLGMMSLRLVFLKASFFCFWTFFFFEFHFIWFIPFVSILNWLIRRWFLLLSGSSLAWAAGRDYCRWRRNRWKCRRILPKKWCVKKKIFLFFLFFI
jgi:hypothetical protein